MPSSWTQNYYHMVFGTRDRAPWITPEIHDRLYAFIGGICKDLGAQLLAGNGRPDHVHLLIRFPPDIATATLAREIKARSSKWLHESVPGFEAFAWQRGYGGFTVSHSALDRVERYIRDQETHHRELSFHDEFTEFLKRHGVQFDPRAFEQ